MLWVYAFVSSSFTRMLLCRIQVGKTRRLYRRELNGGNINKEQDYHASGMGAKSPVQPFFPAICRKIPSEPLTGRPRSAKLCDNMRNTFKI